MERVLYVVLLLPGTGMLLWLVCEPLAARFADRPALRVDRLGPVAYGAVLVAVTVAACAHAGWSATELGLRAPSIVGAGLALVAGLAGGVGAYAGELWFMSRVHRPATQAAPAVRAARSWLSVRYGFLVLSVLTAVLEEILWRGFLIRGLRTELWLGAALAVQAVLFGLNHAPFGRRHVIAKAFSGLAWGLLAVLFGAVWAAIVAHLTFQGLVARRMWRQEVARVTHDPATV
ncbi:CPBP family intramembrane glutamic endopeptidase [Phytohabitans rumicis]|uniref:CAAX prenyl protease 2/Lysostaphin resistance protein A-like domain-containing protein n=1 Tax=Phytohabitans rumicis TaxID=1076125 RepID=A0A6V8LEC8_9ACTN|nr:CPBP family intramembrane glutamic endopeptidase [Phytohabitans rumicis]GFJ94644.1 hypothetical protein Prum_082860 [Phytohabitans rumicis]